MPDVIIKGMEMPESCYYCVTRYTFFRELHCDELKGMAGPWIALPYKDSRHPDCPLRPAPEWISVEEALPENEKPVLAYYGFEGSRETGMWYMGTLTYFAHDPVPHWQHESTGLCVTHWMPLPNPPEEVKYNASSEG